MPRRLRTVAGRSRSWTRSEPTDWGPPGLEARAPLVGGRREGSALERQGSQSLPLPLAGGGEVVEAPAESGLGLHGTPKGLGFGLRRPAPDPPDHVNWDLRIAGGPANGGQRLLRVAADAPGPLRPIREVVHRQEHVEPAAHRAVREGVPVNGPD